MDIKLAAEAAGDTVHMLTRSDKSWPISARELLLIKPDYCWATAGHGSIEACAKDPQGAFETHVNLPLFLLKYCSPETKIGLFSTDYIADEHEQDDPNKITKKPGSIYALTKACMEQSVKMIDRPNVSVFRVSTLYGVHYPLKTFPGKLLSKYNTPGVVKLPQNHVTPTSTKWIAETIIGSTPILFSAVGPQFHNCAASNGTSVMNFGRKILGEGYQLESRGMDWDRPAYSQIGCSFTQAPTWEQMWLATEKDFAQWRQGLAGAGSDSPSP